jgi:thymidylate synthase (FAD)
MGTDITVVNAARVSFGKNKKELDDNDLKLIKYLIKHKHTSTLEHNLATFRFKVPLFVRSQHHRHRTWSYNEISRRYTEENIEFYLPKTFRTQHKSNRQASNNDQINPIVYPDLSDTNCGISTAEVLESHSKLCLQLYETMIDKGVAKEQARMVLPQNMYTTYYGTVNLNNLLKFVELRTHDGAQQEIQDVAKACLELAKSIWPVTINAYYEVRGEK